MTVGIPSMCYTATLARWLATATGEEVDYLVMLGREHFTDVPDVARKSGLWIGIPGDFLVLRIQLEA